MTELVAETLETGKIPVYHLKRFWSKAIKKRDGLISQDAYLDEWQLDTTLLNVLGVGIEQTIIYLYHKNPSFETFEDWILTLNGNNLSNDKIEQFNASISKSETPTTAGISTEYLLSDEDLAFWEENGYLIIRNAVSKEDCDAVIKAICEFINVDLTNPSGWYYDHPARQGIMVQLFQHPALEKNRNSTKIRSVYEQLWKTNKLFVSTDRVSFNPPISNYWRFPGPDLHWDVSLKLPIPFGLQGLLYLSDTQANQGAFTLVPGFHHKIDNWINNLPEGALPRFQNLHALGSTPIAANAGDFIVWHQALPHGSSPNTSDKPRMVQYINYMPIDAEIKTEWE